MATLDTALAELRVVDLGRGKPSAIAVKLLADLGASVSRFEPPDEPFAEIYPAYRIWQSRLQTQVVDGVLAPEIDLALKTADVCIVGGEDFPDYDWAPSADVIAARHPHLVILNIQAYPDGSPHTGRPGVELLVQARSGAVFEQFSDRPIRAAFDGSCYGAALQGLAALLGALCQRERDGTGQIVSSSMYEGMLTTVVQHWFSAANPAGAFHFVQPINPRPLIFRCRDGRYIHFVLGSFGSKGRVYRILQIDDPTVGPDDSGMPTGAGDPKNFYGDVDVLAEHVRRFDSDTLLKALLAAGVAANLVLAPGECWDDVQVAHLGLVDSSLDGRHVGLPMRGRLVESDAPKLSEVGGAPGAPPLAGVRVIDYGMFVAGPYGSVALADLGADVIKLEPLKGEPSRGIYRSFSSVNRGKRSIALDMKSPAGMEIAARLAATAQVLHNNFRPGVSVRLGVDPASQLANDPGKIVLEATGCGRDGPSGDRAGFDMIFQAFCGHEVRAGGEGHPPMWHRSSMVDFFLGAMNAVATLVALWRRFRGCGGADLDLSLLDSGVFLISELIETAQGERVGAPLLNEMQTGFHPAEALYRCADGWIAVAARGDVMADRVAKALHVVAGPRAGWSGRESAAIGDALASLPVASALLTLKAADVWAELAVKNGERMLDNDDDDLVHLSRHPVYGEVRQLGGLFRLSGRRVTAAGGSAGLGADTRAILGELGYGETEIDRFYREHAVA